MHPYSLAVEQPRRMLVNLLAWLDKVDDEDLVERRLAPDMYPLRRQIQAACDAAKLGAARLAGRTAPTHADEETTLAELRARVQTVIDYLDTFTREDLDGAAERTVKLPFLPEGKGMTALDYLNGFAAPNFSFHAGMTYAILRHNGVDLGKRDYLGAIPLIDV